MKFRVDFNGVKIFKDKIMREFGGHANKVNADEFMNEIIRSAGSRLLSKIVKRTPVDTGQLRQNWEKGEAVKNGIVHKIRIENPVEYASYVEYGHRQQVGRYVPAIDKKLVKPWVEGQHFVEKSLIEMEEELPDLIEEKLIKKFLEITND